MKPRDAVRHPAALLSLIAVAVLGAATATPWQVQLPAPLFRLGEVPPPENPLPTPSPAVTQPAGEPTDNDTLLTILLALAALAVALLLWHLGRKVVTALRDSPEPPPDPDHLDTGDVAAGSDAPVVPLPELADAVTRALDHLTDADTPDDAVVAAWIALEGAASEHGTRRHPSQTPTEFTQDVLDGTPAPPDDVRTLRTLYQHARFTARATRPDQVSAARHALTAIARSLDSELGRTP